MLDTHIRLQKHIFGAVFFLFLVVTRFMPLFPFFLFHFIESLFFLKLYFHHIHYNIHGMTHETSVGLGFSLGRWGQVKREGDMHNWLE